MSKLIPQTFIDDLLTRIDIVDIVGSRVKLKRTGSNLVGLCPFHTEKTPSFTVSSNKQFFHCFGCGAHGNAIGFLMQFEHLSFIETIENLASQIGLTVPKISTQQHNEIRYSELYDINEKAATIFEQKLAKSPRAINYLKSRGLTGTICKKFRVGYALNEWDNLITLYKGSLAIKQHLLTAGLLTTKNDNVYSRFRDRIMFPIRDARGHIIGFGGRAIDNDPAKYLNSPETPIFHKGEELYGLYEAKKAAYNLKSIIVVEGYLDVISLAQFGISNAVATLGTAISTKQIQLLLRNTHEIVFCFDGDQAGRTAAWRALENSLPIMRDGIQIKFLFLPEEHDPDTLIRQESKENFYQRIENATTLSDFFINHLVASININTIDGKAKLTQTSRELLKKMPLGIFRQLLSNKIAMLVNINPEELVSYENKVSTNDIKVIAQTQISDIFNISQAIQNIINILLHYSEFTCELENLDNLKNIKLTGVEVLLELIALIKKQPNISMGAILEYWRDRQEFELFNKLACKEPIIPKETLKNELIGAIQMLEKLEQEVLIQTLLAKAAAKELKTEERQKLQNLIALSKK